MIRLGRSTTVVLFLLAVLSLPVIVIGVNTVTSPSAGSMNAHFINVGQGALELLEFSCGIVDDGLEVGSGGRQQRAAHHKVRDSHIPYLGVTQRSTANPSKLPTPPGKAFSHCGTVPTTALRSGLSY
jgi:hypothetical protein